MLDCTSGYRIGYRVRDTIDLNPENIIYDIILNVIKLCYSSFDP